MQAGSKGRFRSYAELELIAQLTVCSRCGDARSETPRLLAERTEWRVLLTCKRCQTERQLTVEADDTLFAVSPPHLHVGGAQPSAVRPASWWVEAIDALAVRIAGAQASTDASSWRDQAENIERILTCLNELEKFIADDQPAVPVDALTPEGVIDQRARSERYTRAWIAHQRELYSAFLSELAVQGREILDRDRLISRTTPPRGRLDAVSLAQHRAWLAAGGIGAGRLEVVTADESDLHLESGWLSAVRLEGVLLRRAMLHGCLLDAAVLVDVDLSSATLTQTTWFDARLRGCSFQRADLRDARMLSISAADCSFAHASLAGAWCDDGRFERVSFRGADLRGVSMRRAVLLDCDLRGTQLAEADFADATVRGCLVDD